MKRREFSRLTVGVPLALAGRSAMIKKESVAPVLKPRKPSPGSRWGLIAPGSPVPRKRIELAKKNVSSLGFEPVLGKHVDKELGFLAGKDEERLEDIHAMFEDDTIEAIWCLRGGYGCTRLLPLLDYDLIRQNPKPLFGYSDITALHHALWTETGLISFHGPIPAAEFGLYNQEHLTKTWTENTWSIGLHDAHRKLGTSRREFRSGVIHKGIAEGQLIGGNLTLLAAMVGTPQSPSYTNKIVFIEDVGEKPYRIDRMITQLSQGSDFKEAAGYVLGIFNDCHPEKEDKSLSLKETLGRQFQAIGKPCVYGLPIGHIEEQVTLPQGVQAGLRADDLVLEILESPFA
ncbi:MAG: LD-carboxypeptidase [Saprospiraceae bacterium]|nr:LD-carboxypeptidase [Saprospiraceae bacterium]